MAHTTEQWDRIWRRAGSAAAGADVPGTDSADPRWRRIRQTLLEAGLDLRNLRTIELGSGRGDYSSLLAAAGAAVTLLDVSPVALEAARERFDRLGLSAEFVQADLFRLPSHLVGAFDVALSFGLVEHFRGGRQVAVVRAHARVLRPGGLAFVSAPYAFCPPYRLCKGYLEMRGWWPYPHEYPLTRRGLRRLVRAVGLEPIWTMTSDYQRGTRALMGIYGRSPRRLYGSHPLDRWLGMDLTVCARRPPG